MRTFFRALCLSAALCGGFAMQPAHAQTAQSGALLAPDWVQSATRGVDAAVSEDGQRWYVGTDGRAYRWNESSSRWVQHGTRADLVRIDAARNGVAALTRSGELVLSDGRGDWRATGMRASDVGLGGGRIWLADALAPDRSRAVMTAAFDPANANPLWIVVPGRVERIDVDGVGRPWALDAQGRLFVYADGQWMADTAAPAAADVGVGANGTVLVIGRAVDAALGGGTLHARDPQSGAWSPLPGRLTAVSVEADGRAFGVNSLSWVIGGTRATGTVATNNAQSPATQRAPDEVSLADLAPAGVELPESLGAATVKVLTGNAGSPNATVVGEATLNGLPTRVARYAPTANGPANLLLVHRTLKVGDYVPDLRDTAARDFTFSDVVVSFVPAANADKKPRSADANLLANRLGLADFASFAPPAGSTLSGTLDLAGVPGGAAASNLLGLGTSKLQLVARNIDAALFKEVREGPSPVAAVPARTLKDLADKYGAKLIESLTFEAPLRALEGQQFGPAKLSGPTWLFALAQGEESVTLSIGLAATMGLNVLAPAPDSGGQAASTRSAGTVRATPETLQLSDVRVLLEPLKRSATLNGQVTRAAADRVAALKGFAIDSAAFSGQLALADGETSLRMLTSLKTLDLALNSTGTLPSRATTSGAKIDLEVKLALNDERDAVVPSVTATGGVTLADIVGNAVPGANRIVLTRVEWTPGTVAGDATLYGLPVRAVRHQTAGPVIVGLQHRELDLGSYIPAIRGTNLGSFGLANAVLYVLPESAQAQRYETRAVMPAPLANLLDRSTDFDTDIFPLTLAPGVNIIGLYGTKGNDDGGVSARVKAAHGMEDKSYIVKGSFKVSALANARLESGSVSAPRRPSAREVACAVDRSKLLEAAGLDLSFRLPDFRPPYADKNVKFSNTRFALREIEGQLEPAIETAMTLTLPATGINEIGLATKLRVRGELDILCKGVSRDSAVEIAFAGATALNLADVGKTAFAALERVTKLDAPEEKDTPSTTMPADPAQARALALAAARAKQFAAAMAKAQKKIQGWKPAFGLPFLEIRQFAAAGTFGQKDGKRNLTGTLWTSSIVGSETMDVLGSLTLESDAAANEFKLADWLLRVPGPVRLTGLPGVDKLAAATPAFDAGDFTVSKLDLTPRLMSGVLSSAKRAVTGSVVVIADAQDGAQNGSQSGSQAGAQSAAGNWQLFAAVNRLAPNMLLKPDARLPGAAGDLTLGRTLFALRTAGTATVTLAGLPPRAAKLFGDTLGDLFASDSPITLVRGVSIGGRLNPSEIPDRPAFTDLKAFFDTLEMNQPMPVFGGVEAGQGRRFLEAWLPKVRVPGLLDASLSVANARLSFANLAGRALRAEADLFFVPPPSISAATGSELTMRGLIDYTRSESGDTRIVFSGQSNASVQPTFGLTGLSFSNLGLEVETKRSGRGAAVKRSKVLTLTADADFRGLAARARFGQTLEGAGRGSLLELVARENGQLLELDTLVRSLPLLPRTYSFLDVASYLSLKSRGILIATEAGSGRVSLAAEDAEGQVNGQTFKGQIAIAGLTSPGPVMFLANDAPWTPARVFPAAIPKGPFADLPLPEGLVMLSPTKGDANVSELHPRIYDKVFAKLYGAREAAKVLTPEGLTVVGKLNLSRNLPAPMKAALGPAIGFLPASGDLIAGGGIDAGSGGLAFYVDVKGLKLPIPALISTFVRSTDGDVQVFFKTAGASGAGTEAGVAADVQFGLPRLDNPSTLQTVKGRMSLAYAVAPGAAPALSVAVDVPGRWDNPAGLDGFSLTNTQVAIGTSAAGNTVSVATQRAQFKDKAFALDLNTAWVGGAPTQLSVQFAKSPDTAELIITPALQAELAASVLQVALKGGSSLQSAIGARLGGQPGFNAAARQTFNSVATLIGKTANGAAGLMRNSPLSMIGVRNPEIFFNTPGNDLPDRPGIERPPFGLGLLVKGSLIFDIGSEQVNIAGGEYKINLRDGFYVKGSITPPAPFSSSSLTLSGVQPLGAPAAVPLSVSGKLELPGMKLAGVVDANLSGSFSFKPPPGFAPGADVSSVIRIGSLASRSAYFTARTGSLKIYSASSGGCTDVPLKLDGTLSGDTLKNPAALLRLATLDVPDPVKCAAQLGHLAAQVGKEVGKAAEKAGQEIGKGAEKAFAGGKDAAVAAFRGAQAAVAAVGSAFGAGGTKVCNQRIGWLRERGNVPTRAASQAMIDNLYIPMLSRAREARELAQQLAIYRRNWLAANAALAGISEEWNKSAGAFRVEAFHASGAAALDGVNSVATAAYDAPHDGSSRTTSGMQRYHTGLDDAVYRGDEVALHGAALHEVARKPAPKAAPRPPAAPARRPAVAPRQAAPQSDASQRSSAGSSDFLGDGPRLALIALGVHLDSGAKDFSALAPWPEKWANWDNGQRREADALWWRCANAWTADVPVRTALGWNLPVVRHKGDPAAMFMGNADYENLKARIAAHVNQKGGEIAGVSSRLKDFSAAWTTRSVRFNEKLIEQIHRSTGVQNVEDYLKRLGAEVEKNPGDEKLQEQFVKVHEKFDEYGTAVAALHAQIAGTLDFGAIPNRQQIAGVMSRVTRAVAELRSAMNVAGTRGPTVPAARPGQAEGNRR